VKYVLFHEMLHLKYPTEYRAVRRCVHTREFRQAERQFEDLEKAKRELQRFVELIN
jgi:predicted metal-dependent hydrolase